MPPPLPDLWSLPAVTARLVSQFPRISRDPHTAKHLVSVSVSYWVSKLTLIPSVEAMLKIGLNPFIHTLNKCPTEQGMREECTHTCTCNVNKTTLKDYFRLLYGSVLTGLCLLERIFCILHYLWNHLYLAGLLYIIYSLAG